MDLPTYTSIWRIEKRLYKLYDFRLPMPLPIGQLSVFAAIAVPYVVLLTMLTVPLNHTLIWLYVLPPGVATWLATRPVLESKRLPELIRSQVRYLAEPKVWCRMAPLAERDVVVVTGKIWRLPRMSRRSDEPEWADEWPDEPARWSAGPPTGEPASQPVSARRYDWGPPPVQLSPPARWPAPVHAGGSGGSPPRASTVDARGSGPSGSGASPRDAVSPRVSTAAAHAGPALAGQAPAPVAQSEVLLRAEPSPVPVDPALADPVLADPVLADPVLAEPMPAAPAPAPVPARRPAITVVHTGEQVPPPPVERALASSSGRRGDLWAGRVSVTPGGQRPGKPDQLQRDRARARLALGRPRRVAVLGCTVGAGQTVTTLLTGEVLASLRSDDVAVLDLNSGPTGLSQRAQARPALGQAASLGHSRLVVLEAGARPPGDDLDGFDDYDHDEDFTGGVDPVAAARAFADASARYQLVLADPSTVSVPRLLLAADLLVLVAPASAAAVSAISMTFEWLDAHGQAGLAAESIMVLNGVSRRSAAHVEQAERVCAGQCRAIVRVPWDETLKDRQAKRAVHTAPGAPHAGQHWSGLLGPGTVGAYTALAGLIVVALAESPERARCWPGGTTPLDPPPAQARGANR